MHIQRILVPVMLPHEILFALWNAGDKQVGIHAKIRIFLYRFNFVFGLQGVYTLDEKPLQFAKSILGNWDSPSLANFWQHCWGMEEWMDHPVLNKHGIDLGRPFTLSMQVFTRLRQQSHFQEYIFLTCGDIFVAPLDSRNHFDPCSKDAFL